MPPENTPSDPITAEPIIAEPRFPAVSRRAFLRRSSTAGLSVAALALLAACSEASLPDLAQSSAPEAAATTAATTHPSATAEPTANTEPTEADPSSSVALPDGSALQIDFTYEASSGRVESPYIAVWVEDVDGHLVQAISLWFKADESKYLRDLTRWNALDDPAALSTGATRTPGAFAVSWDGLDIDGQAVLAGNYYVCIESSREDGPYQIIREQVALSPSLEPTPLTPDGELVSASVSVVV